MLKIACTALRRGREGVRKVAFKLTKSYISQIRLWLFLGERGGVKGEGVVKYGVKGKERWVK